MAADIGPKIGIQGEAKFRSEIKAINVDLKTLGTEMQAVTSAFIGQEDSVEALTEENRTLGKTIDALKAKLETQKQLWQQYVDANLDATDAGQKLKQDINRTTAALNKAEAEFKQNAKAIEKFDDAEEEAADDGFDLRSALEGVGQSFGLSSSQAKKLTDILGSGAAECVAYAAAIAKITAELIKLSNAAAKHADEIATIGLQYNLSTKDIQKFQYISELTDVSVDTITSSISKLTRSMDNARSGSGDASEAFKRLGVSITNSDGTLRSAGAVFSEVIDALGRVGNETERDALAMDVFGKSAADLNPLIKQGSAGLKELADEAENSGYVMSEKMVAMLNAGDDATQRFDKAMDGLKNTIGAGVTPIIAGWKLAIADAANGVSKFIQELAGMRNEADAVADAVEAAGNAVVSFRDITAEDLIPTEMQSYKDYVTAAMKHQQETGQQVTIYSPEALRQGYQQPQQVNVSIKYEGSLAQLGRVLQPVVTSDGARVGQIL